MQQDLRSADATGRCDFTTPCSYSAQLASSYDGASTSEKEYDETVVGMCTASACNYKEPAPATAMLALARTSTDVDSTDVDRHGWRASRAAVLLVQSECTCGRVAMAEDEGRSL